MDVTVTIIGGAVMTAIRYEIDLGREIKAVDDLVDDLLTKEELNALKETQPKEVFVKTVVSQMTRIINSVQKFILEAEAEGVIAKGKTEICFSEKHGKNLELVVLPFGSEPIAVSILGKPLHKWLPDNIDFRFLKDSGLHGRCIE